MLPRPKISCPVEREWPENRWVYVLYVVNPYSTMRNFRFITRSLSRRVGKIHTAISSYCTCIAISRFIPCQEENCV